ncbi:MAG: GNAT family N-acetyltransferase [Geminicoccaceae bacterium]
MQVKLVQGIERIDAAAWDACAGADNPFVGHTFLSIMEASGSASGETGWLPLHVLVEDDGGQVHGCAPMYVKSHSYGEYVFDWGWADAFERAGGRYYPKLQISVPFTPVPGPRLMVRPGADIDAVRAALIAGIASACEQLNTSSAHITFCGQDEQEALGEHGFLRRMGVQYHWHNRSYRDFDDFLDVCKSAKRKQMRKERAKVRDQGIEIETLSGSDIERHHWQAFWPFYLATVDKRWGNAYLTRDFFAMIGERMPERVVLVMARADGAYVGGALNLRGADTLYGRIWGCLDDYRFLHFEACYYAAIDYAIATGLKHVEAGAQGTHKLQRGYEPVATYSAHWISHPGLRDAVERFVHDERIQMRAEMENLKGMLPFREDAPA